MPIRRIPLERHPFGADYANPPRRDPFGKGFSEGVLSQRDALRYGPLERHPFPEGILQRSPRDLWGGADY